MQDRFHYAGEEEQVTPSLVYLEDVLRRNTQKTIDMAGGAERLWPHVKSHKTSALIRMQLAMGIRRFKCATLAEAKMVAACGASELLLAYPLVGANIPRYVALASQYPETTFYALEDDLGQAEKLNALCLSQGVTFKVFIDVNTGLDRTGIPMEQIAAFTRALKKSKALAVVGLHCYDGHIHQTELSAREQAVNAYRAKVDEQLAILAAEGIELPLRIMGGSPTFPLHAKHPGDYLSPGTTFLWDWGYLNSFPDLDFEPAAAVAARVVSHPAPGVFTLDLGYKAIAADPAGERGHLTGMPGAEPLFQNEEHWVWRMKDAKEPCPPVGAILHVIPTHICPTSALYDHIILVKEHGTELIEVTGRSRIVV